MKKEKIFLAVIVLFSVVLLSFKLSEPISHLTDYAPPRSGGAAAQGLGDRTGSPIGGSGASCSNCHSGGSYSPTIAINVFDDMMNQVTSYTPGEDYVVQYSVVSGSGSPAGFGMQSLLISNTSNDEAGVLNSVITPNTQIASSGSFNFAEHSGLNTSGTFQLNWTAPTSGFGEVSIYARGLALNGNGNTTGDESTSSVMFSLTETCIPNATTDTQLSCGPYTWSDGNTYNANTNAVTQTLTNVGGCDSIVTLNLTISSNSSSTDIQEACGTYTWIDGNTYNSNNNTATHTIPNALGCDSLITLNLTLLNNSSSTDIQTACTIYTWIDGITYNANNTTATHIIPNSVGCDSIITLDLTITSTNTALTQEGNILTANENGAIYQWIDCPGLTTIDGATNQSFTGNTSQAYAVIVTQNGCADTSDCQTITNVSLIEKSFKDELIIYPNPTNGKFSVDLGQLYSSTIITILDINGRVILTKKYNNSQLINLTIDEPNGIYQMRVESNDKKATLRIIKE